MGTGKLAHKRIPSPSSFLTNSGYFATVSGTEVCCGVKTGKAQIEQMFSDLPSTADIGVHGWRFSYPVPPPFDLAANLVWLSRRNRAVCD
jgi:hypothetical protein